MKLPGRGKARADLAIDLGTSNTRVVARGKGVVLEAPTVIATALRGGKKEVVAIGKDAKLMAGRTPPGTTVIRPVRGGVIADFEATEMLLRALLSEVGGTLFRKPSVLVCIASGTTEVERRAVQESARAAGAGEVFLASTALCAAFGAGLPVSEPVGSMVIDVGGGRTEVGVLSLGGIVVRRSLQIAGDALEDSIVSYLRREHSLLVGERTAEVLKQRVATAVPELHRSRKMRVRGRDMATGHPREHDVTAQELTKPTTKVLEKIRDVVLEALRDTPPELSGDILDRGILLAGGTSHFDGLETLVREATGLPALQAEHPSRCVARGAGMLLEDNELFDRAAATT